MSRTVTALYDTPEEARHALHVLKAEVRLDHADTYDRSLDRLEALESLDLSKDEMVACRLKLASGGYLLLAQVPDGEDPQAVVSVLERLSEGDGPAPHAAAPPPGQPSASEPVPTAAAAPPPAARQEQPQPADEEQVRVGDRELVRGGATVRSREQELPRLGEVELLEEIVRVETRPSSRLVSAQELEQAGLLRDRLIEIAQMREEPVIEKQAFVREEVVVTKATERRVEQVPMSDRQETQPDRAGSTLEDAHGR